MNSNNTPKGFKVPKGYFEDNKTKILENIGNVLHEITEDNFSVPENYFETSKRDILNKIKTEKQQPKVISIFNYRIAIGIAASLLLLFTLTFVNQKQPETNTIATKQLQDPVLNQKEGIKHSLPLSKKDKMLAIFVEDNTTEDDLIEEFLLEDEIASTLEEDF